jgi:hypothetical protein
MMLMEAAQAATTNKLGMPDFVEWKLGAATITAMRKVQRENPELWARIKARAAEIREGRAPEYGGK